MHALGILTLAGIGITLVASNASALRFTDASYLLPKGVVGKPYVHGFELAKGGGRHSLKTSLTLCTHDMADTLQGACLGKHNVHRSNVGIWCGR